MPRSIILFFVPLALLATLLVACQAKQPDPIQEQTSVSAANQMTESEHRERVQQAWHDYEAALLEGDAERAVSMYSEDVTIRGSNTLHGRATYRDRVEGFFSTTSIEYLKDEVEDVIVMGNHVFVAGSWAEQYQRMGSDTPCSCV